jgi:antitoxin component of MazEF toxin-antitoxin module
MLFQLFKSMRRGHMDLVQLDENNEVTIPASNCERIDAKIGDLFTMQVDGGKIIIEPLKSASGQFGTDAMLERNSWD